MSFAGLDLDLLVPGFDFGFATGIEFETSLLFCRFEADCSFVVAALFLSAVPLVLAALPRATLVVCVAAGMDTSLSPRPRYWDATDRV